MGSRRNQKWAGMNRQCVSTGQLERMSIPGYTGHIPGRNAENISGATHAEAAFLSQTACSKRMAPRSGADSERTRQWRGFDVISQSIDKTCMNAGIGTSNLDGITQQLDEHGPWCKTTSNFHNPKGHTKHRSGATVPGYCGHIPGKYAGNVFGSTFAEANVVASGVRRREGAENGTNWILACEFDKTAKNYAAPAEMRKSLRNIGFHEGVRDPRDFSVTAPVHSSAAALRVSRSLVPRSPSCSEPGWHLDTQLLAPRRARTHKGL